MIEGVFAVPAASSISGVPEVDRDGVRVGVKEGSGYDPHLGRALRAATVVRGAEGADVADQDGLEVPAVGGARAPRWVAAGAHRGRLRRRRPGAVPLS